MPGAPFEVLDETATTARIDGHWGFGQVVSTRAMRMAIEKAKVANVAAVTVFRQSHVGRVADYPLMAAREGMFAMMVCDSGRAPKVVVPFGGREARLGTNPICMALPSDLPGPVFIDMATSAAAGNKIAVYRNRHKPLPEGWIIDRDGNPTTDPEAYYRGGAILPLGGAQGYKGYGLSFMVESLSAILTGLGFGVDPTGRHNDGSFMAVFRIAAFRPLEVFKAEIGEFVHYLKSTPRAAGVREIYYPGELEYLTEQQRRRDGIEVEDDTWAALAKLAAGLGLKIEG